MLYRTKILGEYLQQNRPSVAAIVGPAGPPTATKIAVDGLGDHLWQVTNCGMTDHTRVESGSDDPDNLGHLGHFFGGSSGSHLQTKLSGCDPNITCSLRKQCWHLVSE